MLGKEREWGLYCREAGTEAFQYNYCLEEGNGTSCTGGVSGPGGLIGIEESTEIAGKRLNLKVLGIIEER